MPSTPSLESGSLAVETIDPGKWFGTRAALDGVDLEVPRGVAFGFSAPTAQARPR
jgi:ABC-type multidrug transport system ATPase subunit